MATVRNVARERLEQGHLSLGVGVRDGPIGVRPIAIMRGRFRKKTRTSQRSVTQVSSKPTRRFIAPRMNDPKPPPLNPLMISKTPMMSPPTPRMIMINVGTVSAAIRGCLKTNSPAIVPTMPVRRDQIHGIERSTKTWTRESTPWTNQ